MKTSFEVYKKSTASKPHLMVGYSGEYSDSGCKTLSTLAESHASLEHIEDNKYTATISEVYYTLSEDAMKQYTCNNVEAGKRYPAAYGLSLL